MPGVMMDEEDGRRKMTEGVRGEPYAMIWLMSSGSFYEPNNHDSWRRRRLSLERPASHRCEVTAVNCKPREVLPYLESF